MAVSEERHFVCVVCCRIFLIHTEIIFCCIALLSLFRRMNFKFEFCLLNEFC